MIRFFSIVLCVLAVFVSPRVFAQALDSRANLPFREMDSGLVLRNISWGWKGDALPVETHAPVRIWLDSGEKPVSGTISIEYSQDASQTARHVAQFATTPGKGTMVEFALCVKSGVEQFFITIDDGEETLKIPVVQFPSRDQLGIPALPGNQLRIVGVGVSSIASITTGLPAVSTPDWNSQQTSDEVRDYAFSNAEAVRLAQADLPTSWIAYESVDALVMTEDELLALPQRQREAIDAWVLAGGTLVVQVAAAGEGWRRAVPQGMWTELSRDGIILSEGTKVPLPGQFSESLQREARAAKAKPAWPAVPSKQVTILPTPEEAAEDERLDDSQGPTSDSTETSPVVESPVEKPKEEPPADEADFPKLATTVSGRVATLSESATRAGWKVLFAESVNSEQRATSGLIVGGPAGFGTVILVGADPDRFAAILSDNVAGCAWRTILAASLPADAIEQYRHYNQWRWFQSSGANETQQEAVRACMDMITAARPVSPWFFFITAIAMFLMALMIGPVGRVFLKRRNMLTRSWVVALSLIAGASVLSMIAPKLVRSGQSMIGRLDIHDVRCDSQGQPVRAATTQLVTMFSGKPESMAPIDGFDPKSPSFAEGCWWRGVSSVQGSEVATRFGDPLTMISINPAMGVLRSAPAMPIKMGQWTFRAAIEQSPSTSSKFPLLRAELRGEGKVHLTGIPEGKRLDAVWVYADGAGMNASSSAIEEANKSRGKGGSADIVVDEGKVPARISDWLAIVPTMQGNNYYSNVVAPQSGQAPLPWYSAMLPGACRRSHAAQILVESGWAMVVVSLAEDAPTDASTSLATQRFEVYRIIVPRHVRAPSAGEERPVSVLPPTPIDQGAL